MGLGLGQLVTRDVSSLPGGDYLDVPGPRHHGRHLHAVGRIRVDLPDHGQDHVAPELRGHAGHADRGAPHPGSASCSGSASGWCSSRASSWSCSPCSGSRPPSWRCWPSPPACSLGVAFSAAIIGFAATRHNDSGFAAMFRFVINPLFLFSGTFFPGSCPTARVGRVDRRRHAALPRRRPGPRRGPGRVGTLPPGRWHVAYLVTFASVFAGRRPSAPEPQAGDEMTGPMDATARRLLGPAPTPPSSPPCCAPGGWCSATCSSTGTAGSSSVSGFFEPLFYLLGIGFGLGSLTDGVTLADGRTIPYQAFVAPGLLAMSTMNGAIAESIFNVFFKLELRARSTTASWPRRWGSARSPSAR